MDETNLPGNPGARAMLLWLLRLLMKLLLRFEITNIEHVPLTGPVIVIMNHIAFLDPVMVLGSFPRFVIPLAKQETFDLFFWGPISRIYGVIPVKRGEADLQAIKSALRVLKNGGLVLLAPEGTRSPTYQMQAGKEGAALIALRSGATIVPVGVVGTHQVKDHWFSFKRAPVHLSVGKPFCVRPQPANGRKQRADLEAITHEMMYRVASELPEAFRGVYGDLDQATLAHLMPLENEHPKKGVDNFKKRC